jgi:hypothetical protein
VNRSPGRGIGTSVASTRSPPQNDCSINRSCAPSNAGATSTSGRPRAPSIPTIDSKAAFMISTRWIGPRVTQIGVGACIKSAARRSSGWVTLISSGMAVCVRVGPV